MVPNYFSTLFFSKIPINIHCWGGLGSQIFSCIVARRLAIRYHQKEIILNFHSSGVTSRAREIPENLVLNINVKEYNDFRGDVGTRRKGIKNDERFSVKSLITSLLERTGLLARLNSEEEFMLIKPWLTEIRGHYTDISLTNEEVVWLFSSLGFRINRQESTISDEKIAVHFRLGDLSHLTMKTHIPVDRLTRVLRLFPVHMGISLFSDSPPNEVQMLFGDSIEGRRTEFFSLSALRTIQECLTSDNFVGTSSKISLWIAIFRVTQGLGKSTWIPKEIVHHFEALTSCTEKFSKVQIY